MAAAFRALMLSLAASLFLPAPVNAEDAKPNIWFTECDNARSHASLRGTQCTHIEAPLDHTTPGDETIELFVRKFPAEGEPIGQLWLVAGGPGESGASFYPFIETVRGTAPGFDLLVPDHRGTGFSTRLCQEEESPSSVAGTALAGDEWGTCFGALNAQADRTTAFTITNAAQDLDLLISRLEAGNRTYLYGVSYGTQLVLRMLTLERQVDLDGVILDSLVSLENNDRLDLSHRSAITDGVGRKVLRECDPLPVCRQYLPGGAEQALQQVLMREDIEELAGKNLKFKLAALLDFPETRDMLPFVIAGLQADDPAWLEYAMARLASFGSKFSPYPQSGSSVPLVSLISRSENNARPDLTAEVIAREETPYLFASPLPSLLLSSGIPLYESDASFGTSPAKIPPAIVLQGTLDPKTPYAGAKEHLAKLQLAGSVKLIPIEAAPHFILMTAPDEFEQSVAAFIQVRRADP